MSAAPLFDPYSQLRHKMVREQLSARGILDPRVLQAMERVPRHEFVRTYSAAQAYEDHPIQIGEGQTISQPYMVASMLEIAEIQPDDVVLEIGTGSGYQTAVLAEVAAEVFSVERYATLAASAQQLLAHLNYANVIISVGDGSLGLPNAAPFDAIIVSAAASYVPPPLIEQLREGGRLLIPIGGPDEQQLQLVRKRHGAGVVTPQYACRFVPLVGQYGMGR